MKTTNKLFLAVATFGLCGLASAGTICPGGNTTNFAHDPDPLATGCNTLITINADSTVTVSIPDATPYDGVEDNLVGVRNNSANAITSLNLSGLDIFGLDNDGVCTFTFTAASGVAGSTYCSNSQTAGTDPGDYYGPTSTFVITDANNGVVNFAPGVASGVSAFFSLEEAPNASLQVVATSSPEPASYALVVSGMGALLFYRRRRLAGARS
jgi:hypothetical protein